MNISCKNVYTVLSSTEKVAIGTICLVIAPLSLLVNVLVLVVIACSRNLRDIRRTCLWAAWHWLTLLHAAVSPSSSWISTFLNRMACFRKQSICLGWVAWPWRLQDRLEVCLWWQLTAIMPSTRLPPTRCCWHVKEPLWVL